MLPGEAGQQPRQHVDRQSLHQPDADRARQGAAEPFDGGPGGLDLGEHPLRPQREHLSGLGEPQAAADLLGQRHADAALQRGELVAGRRARQVQGLGRGRERPAQPQLVQQAQGRNRQRHWCTISNDQREIVELVPSGGGLLCWRSPTSRRAAR
nr:hypothetical protein [Nonomuraea zeae]